MALHDKTPTVFAAQELVSIPEFGVGRVKAKIDTGAYTGALHCEEVLLTKDANGKKLLRFRPINKHHAMQQTYEFKRVTVTSASGHKQKRYAVPISLSIRGKTYVGYIGLTDRSDMRFSILIGRRFLREHKILVDVTIDQKLDDKTEAF